MESQYAVDVGGNVFQVPRAVEAEGGAAIQTYLDALPGYLEAVARDRANTAAAGSTDSAEAPVQTSAPRKGGR